MDKKELAYAKQAVFVVKDWDIFQAIIRNQKHLHKLYVEPVETGIMRKR